MKDLTKCSLCCGSASIDYEALIEVARIAVTNLNDHIRESNDSIRNHVFDNIVGSMTIIQAQGVLTRAKALVKATETLHTLEEGRTRETIKIVNRNKNKREG